jgi:hypothetical protein
MDPVTAIFNFLSTPAGQEICKDAIELRKVITSLILSAIKEPAAKAA